LLYDLLFAYANGGLLGENLETDLTFSSDISRVLTIPNGFSGITPGSPVVEIKFKEAVPISGFEFDFAAAMISSTPIEIMVQLGGSGLSMTCPEAWVIGPVTLSTSVGKATDNDVTLVAAAPNPPFV
jgi:hypothetical protein